MPRTSRDNIPSQAIETASNIDDPHLANLRGRSKQLSSEFEISIGQFLPPDSPKNALYLRGAGKSNELFTSVAKPKCVAGMNMVRPIFRDKLSNTLAGMKPILVPQGTEEFAVQSDSPEYQSIKGYATTVNEIGSYQKSQIGEALSAASPVARKVSVNVATMNMHDGHNNLGKMNHQKSQYFKAKQSQNIYSSARIKTFSINRSELSMDNISPDRNQVNKNALFSRMEAENLEISQATVYDKKTVKNTKPKSPGAHVNDKQAEEVGFLYSVKSGGSSFIGSGDLTALERSLASRAKVTKTLLEGNTRYFIDRIDDLLQENRLLKQERAISKSFIDKGVPQQAGSSPELKNIVDNGPTKLCKTKSKVLDNLFLDQNSKKTPLSTSQANRSVKTVHHVSNYKIGKCSSSLVEASPQNSILVEFPEPQTLKPKQRGEVSALQLRIAQLEAENVVLRQSNHSYLLRTREGFLL
jgi:hypothetical protein